MIQSGHSGLRFQRIDHTCIQTVANSVKRSLPPRTYTCLVILFNIQMHIRFRYSLKHFCYFGHRSFRLIRSCQFILTSCSEQSETLGLK